MSSVGCDGAMRAETCIEYVINVWLGEFKPLTRTAESSIVQRIENDLSEVKNFSELKS